MSKIKFLITLGSAIRNGAVKTIQQAMAFAKREFGEIDKDFTNKIINVFKKEGKTKKGDVVPIKKQEGLVRRPEEFATRKEYERYLDETLGPSDDVFGSPMKDDLLREWDKVKAKNVTPKEGIETLDDFNLSDSPLDDLEKIVKGEGNVGLPKNPKRPGGSLDPVIGMTRGLARKILDKKGIEIGKADPIDVFENTIGFDVLTDVKNLAEEMVEAEKIGRNLKSPDELLEIEGLFDIKVPKNPQKGMTDVEVLDLIQEVEGEKILRNWDPGKGRKPSAYGGIAGNLRLNRTGFNGGGTSLQKLRQAIVESMRPYAPGVPEDQLQLIVKDITLDMSAEEAQASAKANFTKLFGMAEGGRVQAASGGLINILKL